MRAHLDKDLVGARALHEMRQELVLAAIAIEVEQGDVSAGKALERRRRFYGSALERRIDAGHIAAWGDVGEVLRAAHAIADGDTVAGPVSRLRRESGRGVTCQFLAVVRVKSNEITARCAERRARVPVPLQICAQVDICPRLESQCARRKKRVAELSVCRAGR